jgi:hypothetical protein
MNRMKPYVEMSNLNDPDRPLIQIRREFIGDRARTYLSICTRSRWMTVPAPWWATLVVWWCRLFHPRRDKGFNLPSAGRVLRYPIRCRCGCHYEIVRPNTPQWQSPWKRDRRRPRTWSEQMNGSNP